MAEIERNIVNKARRIILEGLINLRRNWETMQRHSDVEVANGGKSYLASFRVMMIAIAACDYMDNDVEGIVNMESNDALDANILSSLTRYLLLELTHKELIELTGAIGNSIVLWSNSKLEPEERRIDQEYLDSMQEALTCEPAYMILILLTDLHHYTFVESAAKCLETY